MRIGVFFGTIGSAQDLEGLVQQVVAAERDGFESFWAPQVMGADALTLFAVAGQRTSRIELGTAVVPIFTRHPLAMAQQALTTNAATGGRLTLGIGLSHKPVVEERFGLEFDRPALRMQEYLAVLHALVHRGEVDFQGQVYRVKASLQVPSGSPFPVVVAALGPRMLRIAGEMAQGTVTWMVGLKTLETHIVPGIQRAASEAGRPAPRTCVILPVAVTSDPPAAFERAARAFQRYGQLPSYRRMLDMEGVEGPAEVAVFGDEVQVERQLRAFAKAGATDLVASIFPVADDAAGARTRALLKSLSGKI